MTDGRPIASAPDMGGVAKPKARPNLSKTIWRSIRAPLAESRFAADVIAWALALGVRFVFWTNRRHPDSDDINQVYEKHTPGIAVFWHGQHVLAPCLKPRRLRMSALFSRSRDAELNARVAERFGFTIIRGSGGRDASRSREKGGARALIALKKAIDSGSSVAMIADIPHGTPREAGLGVVMLARFSGRPIVPLALATSRRKVLEKTWDKTTLNLLFGWKAMVAGEPVHVPANATDEELEQKRREVTASLNAATEKAYRLVDSKP